MRLIEKINRLGFLALLGSVLGILITFVIVSRRAEGGEISWGPLNWSIGGFMIMIAVMIVGSRHIRRYGSNPKQEVYTDRDWELRLRRMSVDRRAARRN